MRLWYFPSDKNGDGIVVAHPDYYDPRKERPRAFEIEYATEFHSGGFERIDKRGTVFLHGLLDAEQLELLSMCARAVRQAAPALAEEEWPSASQKKAGAEN